MSSYDFGYVVGQFLGVLVIAAVVISVSKLIGPMRRRPRAVILAATILGWLFALGTLASPQHASRGIGALAAALVLSVYCILKFRKRGEQHDHPDRPPQPTTGDLTDASQPTPAAAVPQETSPTGARNYVARHWRGALPLGISYWVNLILLGSLGPLALAYAVAAVTKDVPIRTSAFIFLSFVAFATATWLWGVVGVWRSADRHKARGGAPVWAVLAKIAVLLGMFSVAGQFSTTIGPQIREFGLLAIGKDPIGDYSITILSDGKSALIRGMLRVGSARQISSALDAAPGVSTIVLSSQGGRLAEAKVLADLVRSRGMNTYVEDVCLSACTFVFIAGRDRAAFRSARIGFHAPMAPGNDEQMSAAARGYAREVYLSAELPPSFINRALSSVEFWFPTREELIRNKVLTRITLDRESRIAFSHIESREEFALALRDNEILRAAQSRYPDIVNAAIDNGWKAKTNGSNDGEVLQAIRAVIGDLHARLAKEGDDQSREQFTRLIVDQAKAVRQVDARTCERLLRHGADVTAILPKSLIEQEQRWLLENLQRAPSLQSPRSQQQLRRALESVFGRLSREHMNVLANWDSYRGPPQQICDATIALYSEALRLPPAERYAALEGLLAQ
jgi:hypothetical protein